MMIDGAGINRRVLIIDDNRAVHEDFKQVLAAHGTYQPAGVAPVDFQIACATQGEEGWQLVCEARQKGEPFAMAFVDLNMPPGWDGVETIARIWEDDPALQIVVCSGSRQGSWAGVLGRLDRTDQVLVLKKPFDPAEARQIALLLTHTWSLANPAADLPGR
jgi:CheY-like chemotaxis protein